jgi:hypothetical protein
VGRKVTFLLKIILGVALAFRIASAQTDSLASSPTNSPTNSKIETVPILSAGVAFVPTVEAGHTTLNSVVAPVLLIPIGDKWLVESRVTFEGDFARRDGTGPYAGAVEKEID